ncbi:MAG: tetratricopeptide repeat protein [Candidatus Phaeomarinobacter sp.]
MRVTFTSIVAGLGLVLASGVLAATAQELEAPPIEAVEPQLLNQTDAPDDVTASEGETTPGSDVVVAEEIDAILENELCHAQFFGDGTPEQAIIHCTRALEAGDLPEGDMVTAHVNRGVAYKLTGQLEAAIEDYTKALNLSPESGDIYTTRANAFLEMAQLDAAINDANKALAFNPEYAAAYFVRGRIFEALGQRSFAKDDFVRAYELAPDNKDIEEKAWAYGSNQN